MKLVVPISILSILPLGSARPNWDRRRPTSNVFLSSERMIDPAEASTECEASLLNIFYDEDIVTTYDDTDFFCTEPTDEQYYCEYIGDLYAESGFAETCAGLDGRVKLANYIFTGDNCKEYYYDNYYPDEELEEITDLINSPECIPNKCTDEEALDILNSMFPFDEIEGCELDVTFPKVNTDGPKASKSKKMKKVKSIKMKKAKSMKEPKSSKVPKASKVPKSSKVPKASKVSKASKAPKASMMR